MVYLEGVLLTTVASVGVLAQANTSYASPGCEQACTSIESVIGSNSVHYPDTDNFTIWDAKQQEARPACRVEPGSSAEVADILKVLVDDWCRFAVKGGGHSRSADDSNSVGGVTIDLGRLATVDVSANASTAQVGGGANSIQIYRALEEYGLSFTGGRVGSVGMGGFALGGGTSPFSNRYGWALDSIFAYEVVLANSTIVTASPDANSDLYWALRGGGNNFGIITCFTIRTFEQGPVFQAAVSYAPNETETVLDHAYGLWADPELSSDLDMGFDLYFRFNSSSRQFAISGTQRYGQAVTNASVFQAIDKVPSLSRASRVDTMSNLASEPPLGVTRNLFGTLTVSLSRDFHSEALQIFREEVSAMPAIEGLVPNFISYPIHSNAISQMTERGGNALGIQPREDSLLLILVSTAWTNASDDTAVWDMTRNVIDRVKATASSLGILNKFIYMNYAWAGQAEEVFAAYGKENEARLKAIQKSVDPEGVFTRRGLWRGFMKLI